MKVLHIIKIAGVGGAEVYLTKTLPEMNKRGISVTLLAMMNIAFMKEAKKVVDIFKAAGVNVIEINVESDFSWKMYRKIAEVIKDGHYDLVNAHLIHAELYMSIVKKFFLKNIKIIATKHGYDPAYQVKHGFDPVSSYTDKFFWLSRLNGHYMDRNITISRGLKKLIVALNIAKEKDVDVIHYGFNYDNISYNPDKSKFRKSPNQILILGRLEEVKGHSMAFEAMPEVIKKFPKAKLVIIGSGAIENQLKQEVIDKKLENNVEFLGFQSEIHDFIKNSDIVLIPSFAEGFCAVVLEAYYNEVPVVCFDVPALNEIVFNNETGIVVPKFDISALSESIIRIFNDPDFAKKLADGGKNKLYSYFTIDRMLNETIDSYNKVLSTSK
jgi:glycosyltransferase involved in cell wall biosynthesis